MSDPVLDAHIPDAPPIPRGFKIYETTDGRFYTCSAPDTRKSKDRVPKQPKKFWLMENEETRALHWIPDDDYPTRPIREFVLEQGLRSEVLFNMQMTHKAPRVSTILRQEYGMVGKPLDLYMQFCRFREQKIHPKMAEKALAEGVA